MNAKRIVSLIVSLTFIVIAFSSCNAKDSVLNTISELGSSKTEDNPGIDTVGFTIPYLRTDSLNPYKATQTINKNISTLLYDSLFSVDNSFKASGLIAQSYTNGKRIITVVLRSDVKFTNGSALTASDVVYSFNLALGSDNYSSYLSSFSSAEATDSYTVVFKLKSDNPFAVNNLIFPIIKSGSDKDSKSSDDYSATIPTGSGRYTVVSSGDTKTLEVNKDRLGSYHPVYNVIGLKDVTEVSSIVNLFSLDEIDFYTDNFTDGSYNRYTGTSSKVSLTNFTYLGINSQTKVLSDSKVRRAVALIINRTDLAAVSFAGCAEATSTPFSPSFYALEGCTPPTVKCDIKAGISLLEDAGFNTVSSSGLRYSTEGKLEISLLVNKDNSFKLSMARSIQQSLKESNISVILKEYSYSDYLSAVKQGNEVIK